MSLKSATCTAGCFSCFWAAISNSLWSSIDTIHCTYSIYGSSTEYSWPAAARAGMGGASCRDVGVLYCNSMVCSAIWESVDSKITLQIMLSQINRMRL